MKETEVVETGKEQFIDRVAWGKMTHSKMITLDSWALSFPPLLTGVQVGIVELFKRAQ